MSKLFGKPGLNGPSHGNFPKSPIQVKPDFGTDQTQSNKPFPSQQRRRKDGKK